MEHMSFVAACQLLRHQQPLTARMSGYRVRLILKPLSYLQIRNFGNFELVGPQALESCENLTGTISFQMTF